MCRRIWLLNLAPFLEFLHGIAPRWSPLHRRLHTKKSVEWLYIYIYIRRPQPAAGEARQRTPSNRKTTGSLVSARAAALASWRLLLAFFLDSSENDVRPSDRAAKGPFPSWQPLWAFCLDRSAARSLPSFTAMLLKRGEGPVSPSWRLLLAFSLGCSESDGKPSDSAAARSLPSFTATVFFFCHLIFGRYPVKHKRLHQEPTCGKPSKHIFKQHAIWDANVLDCPLTVDCVYKHLTFCLLMSLRYPLNMLSHCISQCWSSDNRGRRQWAAAL